MWNPHKTRKASKSLGTQTHEILCCGHLGAVCCFWSEAEVSIWQNLVWKMVFLLPAPEIILKIDTPSFASKIHQLPTWRKIIYKTGFLGEHSHTFGSPNQPEFQNQLEPQKTWGNLNHTIQLQLQPFIRPFASPISEFHCHGQCSYLIGLHTTCTTPRSCSTDLRDGSCGTQRNGQMKYDMRMDEGSIGKSWLHTLKYQFFGMLVVTGDCKSALFDFKQMLIRGIP